MPKPPNPDDGRSNGMGGGGRSGRPVPRSGRQRADYAEVAIPEYWIVDPPETVTVPTLAEGAYVGHGMFPRGAVATSPLLDGAVDVTALFDEAEG